MVCLFVLSQTQPWVDRLAPLAVCHIKMVLYTTDASSKSNAFFHIISFMLRVSCEFNFLQSFGVTQQRNGTVVFLL